MNCNHCSDPIMADDLHVETPDGPMHRDCAERAECDRCEEAIRADERRKMLDHMNKVSEDEAYGATCSLGRVLLAIAVIASLIGLAWTACAVVCQ